MDDDFYEPLSDATTPSAGLVTVIVDAVLGVHIGIPITVLLTPLLVVIATRLLSGRSSEEVRVKAGRTVWMPHYWVPMVGHGVQL
jgi:hypothetical protein